MNPDLIKDFRKERSKYELLNEQLINLLKKILEQNNFPYHSITGRVKSAESLQGKLKRKSISGQAQYSSLSEITDLSGLRIITYFEGDVNVAAEIIKREFTVDSKNSEDKKEKLDPDRFGYRSVHLVISVGAKREHLTEYRLLSGTQSELQIRSILQHAWAEIEHDLGYKQNFEVPEQIRRNFYQAASLLEVTDNLFNHIRESIQDYISKIRDSDEAYFKDLLIDAQSLKVFIERSETITDLDKKVAKNFKGIVGENTNSTFIALLAGQLIFLEIREINQLDRILQSESEKIVAYNREWLTGMEIDFAGSEIMKGSSLIYFVYYLLGRDGDIAQINSYLEEYKIGNTHERSEIEEKIIRIFQKISTDR